MERNSLSNFGRQSPKEHSCENLSTDLAEVKSLFLFIALAAILFNVAELFEQFFPVLVPGKNRPDVSLCVT